MDPLHATIEEHAANYTHPRCRVIRLRAMTSFRKSRWADARSARARGEAFWGYGKKRPGAFSAPSLSLLPNKGALGHRFRRRGRRLGGKRCANATEDKTLVGPVWFQCKKPSTRSAAGLLKTLLHLTPVRRDGETRRHWLFNSVEANRFHPNPAKLFVSYSTFFEVSPAFASRRRRGDRGNGPSCRICSR